MRVHVVAARPARSLAELGEDEWAAWVEEPLRAARVFLQEAVAAGEGVVFVVPSYGIFGASGRVATAAVAEGVRALARSAALAEAVAVNCVVADREDVSAAVRALEAGGLSGQTLLLDGGLL